MTSPLSPDEGVRAALEAEREACAVICDERAAYFERAPSYRTWEDAARSYRATATEIRDRAFRAALSIPVPEEGLPRGSASAAEGEPVAWRWRTRLGHFVAQAGVDYPYVHEDLRDTMEPLYSAATLAAERAKAEEALRARIVAKIRDVATRFERRSASQNNHRALADALESGHLFGERYPSTEAGDGVASALPSPLPSQGEPVGYAYADSLSRLASGRVDSCAIFRLDDRSPLDVPLYNAEALAAERARADRAIQDEKEARAELATCWEALQAQTARADRAEEDVLDRLYAKAAEESRLCASVVFREDAARTAAWLAENGAMLPAQRAALRARTLLKETPDEAR